METSLHSVLFIFGVAFFFEFMTETSEKRLVVVCYRKPPCKLSNPLLPIRSAETFFIAAERDTNLVFKGRQIPSWHLKCL